MPSEEGSNIIEIQNFYSRVLENSRNLYIYLPPSYGAEPDRYFPVLYMQDGQNVFMGETSYSGSGWEIHRVAEDLIAQGRIRELIIVGIAHQDQQRLGEYAHWDGKFQGKSVKGRGLDYEDFLLTEVKPYIEENFRVLKGPENTGIMGSSMGGLVSFTIALRNPKIFGKVGALSPSFWWGKKAVFKTLKKMKKNAPLKLWLDMGKGEGDFSKGFEEVVGALRSQSTMDKRNMAVWYVPEAIHSEMDWMHRVHCPLLYLFGEIGDPQELIISGRRILGVKEKDFGLDVTAVFDTGFSITPDQVIFETMNPEILKINDDGKVIPIKCGSAGIRAQWMGLEAHGKVRIVSELSPKVKVEIHVQVPDLEEEEPLYIAITGPKDYLLEKRKEGYQGILNLDRDSVVSYKITRGTWKQVEKDHLGQDIFSRRLLASKDLTVNIEVENW